MSEQVDAMNDSYYWHGFNEGRAQGQREIQEIEGRNILKVHELRNDLRRELYLKVFLLGLIALLCISTALLSMRVFTVDNRLYPIYEHSKIPCNVNNGDDNN